MTIDLDALEKLADSAATVRRDANGLLDGEDAYRIYHAYFEATPPVTIKALIAELKEARGLLDDMVCEVFDAITSDGEAQDCKAAELADLVDMARHAHRAFLARNGKGEG